ncbi:MAG: VWA domain-containing protein [Pyrinomonadaceae bacterium]
MRARKVLTGFCSLAILCLIALEAFAQDSSATPTGRATTDSGNEIQEPITVSVEEVRIPLAAYDEHGRFDPTVEIDDLLLREDGAAQPIKSVYRIPASVVLLLDTGGESNRAKDVRLTREVAVHLVSGLQATDVLAVVQANNRAELAQDWTRDKALVVKALDHKLLSGKRSALAEAIVLAVERLEQTPQGNRHLVLISDGLDSPGGSVAFGEAVKRLLQANITTHVISYTSLGQGAKMPGKSYPRVRSKVPDEIIMTMPRTKMPGEPGPDFKQILEAKGGTVIDIDRWLRGRKGIRKELEKSEEELAALVAETGGSLWLPLSADEMMKEAGEVAREIDSQYVMTYKPQRPLASAKAGEYRRVDVISRRAGLRLRARRGYVARSGM